MSLTSWLILIIMILFIGGLSVQTYNGEELKYESIEINGSNSTINNGISKIVDGILTICFEFANVIGKGAVKQGININKMFNYITALIWTIMIVGVCYFLTKVFIYVYIIKKEIELSKKESEVIRNG